MTLFGRPPLRWREAQVKGPIPRPRPLQPPCVTPKCICQATGIPPFHGFCKYLPCLFPRRGAVWRRRERSGKGSMPCPRPWRPPCVTPRCIHQATGIPPLHGFCKYLSLPVPSMRGGMAAAGNVGEGVNALPSPLAAPVCDPKMHLPSHWDHPSPWILQIPFPACSLDAGRHGGSGKHRRRRQCPSPARPLSACFPLKYSGGATGSPDCH